MITPLLQLNHRPTIITPLPTRLLRRLKQSSRLLIIRAILRPMPFPVTQTTHLRPTASTLAILLPILLMHISRLDPLPASPRRTVDTVLRGEFLEFPVPILLERGVEEFLDVFERDVVGCAAFGGHVLRVVDREAEDPF